MNNSVRNSRQVKGNSRDERIKNRNVRRKGMTKEEAINKPYNLRNRNNVQTTPTRKGTKRNEKQVNYEKIEEWDDITLMNELINQLNQQLPTIEDKNERELVLDKINKYNERFEALKKTESKSIREEVQKQVKENKNNSIHGSNINWNSMQNLNKLLKEHEIQLAKSNETDKKKVSHLSSMIEIFKIRIQTLLDEKGKEANQNSENPIQPNYKKIDRYSCIALENDDEWDNLSFVHNAILEIAEESVKESDVAKQQEIERVSDMYIIRKQMLLKEMAEYDEARIKNGDFDFEYENNDDQMEIVETNVETNKEVIEINEDENNENVITQDTEMEDEV